MTPAEQFFGFVDGLAQSDSTISCRWSEDRLKVVFLKKDENGFDIEVAYDPASETLELQTDRGYHDHFHIERFESFPTALTNVLGLVRDLLSTNMRIIETQANGKPRKWELQAHVEGRWVTEANTGLLIWNVFGKKSTVEYTNNVLPPRGFKLDA